MQLQLLLTIKKSRTDKPISGLKKKEMLVLWEEWKSSLARWNCQRLRMNWYSINQVSHGTTITGNGTIETIDYE